MKKRISWMFLLVMLVTMFTIPTQAAKVKLNKKKASIFVGQTIQLKVKGTKNKVIWKSSNKKIASVNKKGKVIGRLEGKAKVTAKVAGKKMTCVVTVKNRPCLHRHTETRGTIEATVSTNGYSGDVYCKDCGKLINRGWVIKSPDIIANNVMMVNPNCDISKTEAVIKFYAEFRYQPQNLIVWFKSKDNPNSIFSYVLPIEQRSPDNWYEIRFERSDISNSNLFPGYWGLDWYDAFDVYNGYVQIIDCFAKYPLVTFYVPG